MAGKASRPRPGSFVVPPCSCPACGRTLDRAGTTDTKPRPPKPGDRTVRKYCAVILRYGADLRVCLAPLREWQQYAAKHPKDAEQTRRMQLGFLASTDRSPPAGSFGRG